MIYYITEWLQDIRRNPKGINQGKTIQEHKYYQTKCLTSMHERIRNKYKARTLKYDTSINRSVIIFG